TKQSTVFAEPLLRLNSNGTSNGGRDDIIRRQGQDTKFWPFLIKHGYAEYWRFYCVGLYYCAFYSNRLGTQ
ncbi:hypothetical protein, partial [Vibrio cholerae]|uniref:hypothetical protein n=1 Tax=Vibrio cholerae TaxID=666 RepID=UPI001E3FDF4A